MTTLRHHSTVTAALVLVLLLGSASAVEAQTGVITGTVFDEQTSAPVGDLSVELYDEYGDHMYSVQTGAGTGTYSFTDLDDGTYFVRATSDLTNDVVGEWYQDANEYDFDLAARLEINSSNTLSGIDFHLARGSSISGQLFGLGGGEDIDLSVYDATNWRHRGGVRSNLGSYTIDSLPPSSYKLFADPHGTDRAFQWWDGRVSYNEADIIPVAGNVDITGKDFSLTAGTSISGTVTLDPDPGDGGATLEQIWIDIFESATHEHLDSTNVATDGTYGFSTLPPGSYLLQAQTHNTEYVSETWVTGADNPGQAPVFNHHEAEPVATAVGSPATGIDFLLEEGRWISGNVFLDGVGNVDGASVNADLVDGGYGRGAGTDPSGDYTVFGLAPGQYHVRVESGSVDEPFTAQVWEDKSLYEDPDPVDVSSGDATLVDFVVSQERTVSGKVYLDSNNDQVQQLGEPGFSNLAIRAYDFATGRWLGHAAIAPDGQYSIGVPAGVFQVEASPHHPGLLREAWENAYSGDDATPVDVQTADATGIDFGIVAGEYFGTLRGRVVADGTTTGVPGVDVQVWRFDDDNHILSGQTDADGYFTVWNLPPGSYRVLFDTRGSNAADDTDHVSSFWSSTGIAGDPDPGNHRIDYPAVLGDGSDLGSFELDTGGSISGTVFPPSGYALPLPFNVNAEYFFGGTSPLPSFTVESDGSYHLRGLPDGPFRIHASTWGTGFVSVYYLTPSESTWHQSDAAVVDVVTGVQSTGIDLHLLRGGSISGQVTLASTGDPLPGIQINVNLVDDPQGRGWGDSANTAADGTYIVQGLPTGSYRVRTDDRSGGYGNQIYPADVSVTEPFQTPNIDFELTAPASIGGRVYEDTNGNGTYDAGEERAGVYLQAQEWATGEWFGDAVSDSNGLYEIGGLGVGTYQMWLEPNETNFVRMWFDNSFDQPTQVEISESGGVAQDVGGIDFRVVQGFEIRGFVFWDADNDGIHDAGESPVNNAWINARAVSGPYDAWGNTNPDGTYTVHGVFPGTYHVQSGAQNLIEEYWQEVYHREGASEVDVTSGTVTGIDFSLVDGPTIGTLRGRVIAEGTTTGIPGVDVQVWRFEDDQHITSATTDINGDFVFTNLAPSPDTGYKVYFDTSLSNVGNNKDYVASFWAANGEPGVIDPNLMRIDFPTVPDPATGPGTDLGEFGLATGGSISGTVHAPGGGSLPAGIGVSAHSFESGGEGLPGAMVDGSGNYHIRGLPAPATYRVQADAWHTDLVSVFYWTFTESTFDHWTATAVQVEVASATEDIDLHLLQGGSISGTVTTDLGQTPVPDFPVSASLMNDPLGRGYWHGASTAADGTYTITGLPDGEYEVRTDAREGAFANQTYPDAVPVVAAVDTPDIDFDLVAGGRITGRVTQIVGGITEPLVNIRVEASDFVTGEWRSDGHTDADGNYSIGALTQGRDYRVQVRPWDHPDPQFFNFVGEFYDDELFWELASPVSVPIGAGVTEQSGIDFEIALGGAISGIVTAGGTPVQNVYVSANLFSGADYGNGANTDHNGFYIVRGLPADTYRVHANAWPQPYVSEYFDDTTQWHLATPVSVQVVPEGGPIPITGAIDFDLGPAYTIGGRVTEADGTTPIPNIEVTASGLDVSSWSQAWTNGDGDYEIRSLDPGTYEVAAETYGTDFIRQRQEVDLTSGDVNGVDFALQIGAVMSGRVYVDANDDGVYDAGEERAGVWISASDYITGHQISSGLSDAEGLYEIRGLGAGSYRLHLSEGEHNLVPMYYERAFGWGDAQPVDLTEVGGVPQDLPNIDFRAIQGYEIRGLVFYDANGDGIQQPEEQALNNININADFQGGFWVDHNWTDSKADGTYTLRGVYPGSHLVSAHAGGTPYASELFKLIGGLPVGTYQWSDGDQVDVSGGDATGIDLSLELGGGISGHVKDASSDAALGGIDLYVNHFDGDGLWWGATTDSNGDYLVNGLSPGEHVIQTWDNQEIYVSELYEDAVFWEDASPVQVVARSSITDPLATLVDFDLDEGGAITGVVYDDADGDGVQDAGEPGLAGIGVHLEEFADPRRYIKDGSTDANGDFYIGGLPPDLEMRVRIDTWPTNFLGGYYDGGDDSPTTDSEQAMPLSVSAGGTTPGIDFGLDEGGTITGLVVDGDGTPIPGIHVSANSPDWGTGENTDLQGRYVLHGLMPGDYQVMTGGDTYRQEWYDNQIDRQTFTPVAVAAGVTTSGIDFVLPVMPRITGGPTPASGERGATVTGVTVTADQLTAVTVIDLGAGLTIDNLNVVGDTITFDVVITADAPLGGRSLSVINDQSVEDGADSLLAAFQVLPASGDIPPPGSDRVYVSDNGRSKVLVYAADDNWPLGSIDLCCQPSAIVLSPDGNFAYVNGFSGWTSVIDTRLGDVGKEVARLYLFGNLGTDAMAATDSHLYAIDGSTGFDQIWVVDTETWSEETPIALGFEPWALGIDIIGQTLYVVHRFSDAVSVIDLDPASATYHQVVSTLTVPGGSEPYAVDFVSDGSLAYVACRWDTYVVDTASALSDPGNAVVAHLPGRSAPIDIFRHTASGKDLALMDLNGRVAVLDLSTDPLDPDTVGVLEAGVDIAGFRGADDKIFLSYMSSGDLWVVDTDNLLTSAALSMTRFDGPEPPNGTGYLGGGLAVGPNPAAPPAAAPSISGFSGPIETGSPSTLTISGSNFDPGAAVWLQGTPERGTVTSATLIELEVEFSAITPTGSRHLVVTNPMPGGGASAVSDDPVDVIPPAGLVHSQKLYVTSYGAGEVRVYNQDGSTANIETLPYAAGMGVTPDGNLGFVTQFHDGPWSSYEDLPDHFFDMAVVDLDPASPTHLTTIAQIPWIWTSYRSPAVTPNLNNPNGIFVYAPNRNQGDTVSVIDPATLAEVDIDNDPNTSSLPRNFPYSWIPNGDAMPGINRIELDEDVTDRNLRPNDVALTPDGTLLYVANPHNTAAVGSISIVDTLTYQVIGTLTANGNLSQAWDVIITPTDPGSGVFVYVLGHDNAGDPFLFIFEAGNTNDATAKVDQIPLPRNPRSIEISQDGETIFVTALLGYPDLRTEVYVVDVQPSVRAIVDQFELPYRTYKLIEAPDDQLLYFSALWRSVVFVVDLAPGAGYPLIATLESPACPLDVAVAPSAGVVHPVVGGVTPKSGSPAGGDPVVIVGANFAEVATVEFGTGNFATNVMVVGNYAIEAVTPSSDLPGNGTGPVDVTVRDTDGRFDRLDNGFTYELDTIPPVFTTPPYVASQVLAGVPGSETTTVEIRWRTDEASDSLVDYREVGQPSFLQQSDSALTMDHLITLAGLAPAANHEFRATSADSNGNPVSSPVDPGTVAFTTPTAPDSTPPVISSGPSVSPTIDEALIQWETNEQATSVVQYDAVLGDGHQDSQTFGADGTLHTVNLTGLQAHTEYEFRVLSVDASGNGPTASAVVTFTTDFLPDATPPVIIGGPEPTYLANDLVIVQWQTDEPSTSFVNYGTSSILEQGVVDLDLVTNHVVFLTNLLPGTAYGYQVGSTDPSGNTVFSADPFAKTLQTLGTSRLNSDQIFGVVTLKAGTYITKVEAADGFTTSETPDTTAPVVLSVTVTPLSFDRVLVTVETNEDASLRAHFGVGGLTDSAFNPAFSQQSSLLLAGLEGATTYQLSVELTDPKGNTTTEDQPTFTTPATPDTQAPVISALSVNPISDTTALLTWTTNEPADATVRFGVQGGAVDQQVGRLGLATTHEILVTGLTPATTYDAEAASRDASDNVGTASTTFTTTAPAPVITSVTPSSAVLGASVEVAVNGTHFDGAQVSLGAGVSIGGVTVNDSSTQVRVEITVDPSAAVGPRQITITTDHGKAAADFSIVDGTVPVVEILSPRNGAGLTSLTVAVHGTVSELSEVTVNGVAASVANGNPITFSATVTLPGEGLRGITATAVDPSGNRGTDTVMVMYPELIVFSDDFESGDTSAWSFTSIYIDPMVFSDGFESGNTSAWSSVRP